MLSIYDSDALLDLLPKCSSGESCIINIWCAYSKMKKCIDYVNETQNGITTNRINKKLTSKSVPYNSLSTIAIMLVATGKPGDSLPVIYCIALSLVKLKDTCCFFTKHTLDDFYPVVFHVLV